MTTLNQKFLSQFDAIFFDLDGTLLTGSDAHYEECVRRVGAEKFNIPHIKVHRGMSLRKFLYQEFPEFSAQKTEDFIEEYRKMIPRVPRKVSLFPDAQKIIDLVDTLHIPRVLVTNCSEHELRESRKFLDMDTLFPEIIFSNGIIASKPAPDMYLRAAEIYTKQPKHCLVFEDSLPGIAAGKTAGMTVVALDRHGDLGKNAGADYIIPNFKCFFLAK